MTWLKLAIALLNGVSALIAYLEKQGAIKEGERKQLARSTAAVVAAGQFAAELRDEVSALNEETLNEELME